MPLRRPIRGKLSAFVFDNEMNHNMNLAPSMSSTRRERREEQGEDMERPVRPNILSVFSGADALGSKVRSAKLQRMAASLSWRQTFQSASVYPYTTSDGHILRFDQVPSIAVISPLLSSLFSNTFRFGQVANGEMKGLGTGTQVWPAAHVLAKFLEKHFDHTREKRGDERSEKRGDERREESETSLHGCRVCEIGSGTGLTGVVAAYLGADVTLTDQELIMGSLFFLSTSFLYALFSLLSLLSSLFSPLFSSLFSSLFFPLFLFPFSFPA